MKKITSGKAAVLVIVAVAIVTPFLYRRHIGGEKVSRFGEYQGYSERVYDGNERRSGYLTLSDGTRLAYDLILPTKDGIPASEPLPVLFKYTIYLRTITVFDEDGHNIAADLFDLSWGEKAMLWFRHKVYDRGHLMDPVFRSPWLETMLEHGYAVVVVERPGTGASFGVMNPSLEAVAQEADEILDWIAAQPWSNGTIGMFGDSYEAQTQIAAASTGNPHLKAIFPTSSSMDNYSSVVYPGGVFNESFGSFFSWATTVLERLATPVDRDVDGTLLAQAVAGRGDTTVGRKSAEFFARYPFRDSIGSDGSLIWESEFAIYPFVDRVNQAGVPAYLTNGWYDLLTRDAFVLYSNLTVPRRLVVRPLDHSEIGDNQFDLDYGAESHRWFDYWLKGIDNGIMDEPPIHYYLLGAANGDAWQTADEWPPAGVEPARFYLGEGRTGSVGSLNDGFLHEEPRDREPAHDIYTVDYTTTTGEHSRWNAINWTRDYPDMRFSDEKALTYTTPSLETDVQVSGHPVVNLWLATGAPDLDLFVYLEEVDGQGRATYITEGNLRASHRAQDEAPFDNLDLPHHSHYESALAAIPSGEPIELVLDLLPTSYLFRSGNRIRITVAFADADSFQTPLLNPPPEVRLLRDADHASYVTLPIIPARE
ncbi:MAG TPA: CocE/NonD family hydrolase [Anaerolineae bacterium]|nr:CocE/NonD family hydrolase [Anaerolineae bacterium]